MQTEDLVQSLVEASDNSVSKKLLRIKGPKWKESPQVRIIHKSCREMYKNWQDTEKSEGPPTRNKTLKKERNSAVQ